MASFWGVESDISPEQQRANELLDEQMSETEAELAAKRESLTQKRLDILHGNRPDWNPQPIKPFNAPAPAQSPGVTPNRKATNTR